MTSRSPKETLTTPGSLTTYASESGCRPRIPHQSDRTRTQHAPCGAGVVRLGLTWWLAVFMIAALTCSDSQSRCCGDDQGCLTGDVRRSHRRPGLDSPTSHRCPCPPTRWWLPGAENIRLDVTPIGEEKPTIAHSGSSEPVRTFLTASRSAPVNVTVTELASASRAAWMSSPCIRRRDHRRDRRVARDACREAGCCRCRTARRSRTSSTGPFEDRASRTAPAVDIVVGPVEEGDSCPSPERPAPVSAGRSPVGVVAVGAAASVHVEAISASGASVTPGFVGLVVGLGQLARG